MKWGKGITFSELFLLYFKNLVVWEIPRNKKRENYGTNFKVFEK